MKSRITSALLAGILVLPVLAVAQETAVELEYLTLRPPTTELVGAQTVAVIDPTGWWSPFRTYSLGTCLLQWGLALTLLVVFNRRIAAASLRS